MPTRHICRARNCRALLPRPGYCAGHAHLTGNGKRRAHGRNSSHWQRISAQAIAIYRRCAHCGSDNDLTGHLDPALEGDHRNATIDDVVVLCRTCHGIEDGHRSPTAGAAR